MGHGREAEDAAEKKSGGLLTTADVKNRVRHFPSQILSSLSGGLTCYFGGDVCQGNILFEKSTLKTVNFSAAYGSRNKDDDPRYWRVLCSPECFQPGAVECSTEIIAPYIKN
jgi:hypothetical protein